MKRKKDKERSRVLKSLPNAKIVQRWFNSTDDYIKFGDSTIKFPKGMMVDKVEPNRFSLVDSEEGRFLVETTSHLGLDNHRFKEASRLIVVYKVTEILRIDREIPWEK